jgi:hypothetical protein
MANAHFAAFILERNADDLLIDAPHSYERADSEERQRSWLISRLAAVRGACACPRWPQSNPVYVLLKRRTWTVWPTRETIHLSDMT